MAEDPMERIYQIPLGKVYDKPRTKRAPCAIRFIRKFIARHMGAEVEKVWLDRSINETIWARGIQKPPRRIRVKAVKFPEDDLVEVSLPEE